MVFGGWIVGLGDFLEIDHVRCTCVVFFFFSSRRRHTRFDCDWSSDVCSSDLVSLAPLGGLLPASSTVTVVATSGVQDLSGNALANFKSSFTTAAAFDLAHP